MPRSPVREFWTFVTPEKEAVVVQRALPDSDTESIDTCSEDGQDFQANTVDSDGENCSVAYKSTFLSLSENIENSDSQVFARNDMLLQSPLVKIEYDSDTSTYQHYSQDISYWKNIPHMPYKNIKQEPLVEYVEDMNILAETYADIPLSKPSEGRVSTMHRHDTPTSPLQTSWVLDKSGEKGVFSWNFQPIEMTVADKIHVDHNYQQYSQTFLSNSLAICAGIGLAREDVGRYDMSTMTTYPCSEHLTSGACNATKEKTIVRNTPKKQIVKSSCHMNQTKNQNVGCKATAFSKQPNGFHKKTFSSRVSTKLSINYSCIICM